MRDLDDENTPLRPQFDLLLSEGVGPFLGSMGFTQHGTKFVRYRGPIYDVIGFQNDWHNDVYTWHGFFVNVGVGSREVDEVWPGPCPQPPIGFLFDRRWESVVPDLPYEPRFNRNTDMKEFAAALREGLELVVAVIEGFDCTATLVEYATTNNLLIAYERTCCYLAATEDVDALADYVGVLRDHFGHQERWAIFNREISRVSGACARTLVDRGVLDPVTR